MIRDIFRKEWRELWREGRFKFLLGLVLLLLVTATITGVHQYQKTNEQYLVSKEKEREIWDSQDAKNPHSAAHYGTYAFKPKFAMSLFDTGITKYTGISVFLEAHKTNEAVYSEATDQTELSRFGSLSITYVLLYLFPLIIILIGYNSFSKEIEQKTIRLLKSQGTNMLKLAFGKWLCIFVPIVVITAFIFLIIGGVLFFLEDFTHFSWLSLWVLFAFYAIYYAIITTITLLVSLLSKSSGLSLVVSLSLWVIFSFVMPKVGANIADEKYPYPSKSQFYSSIEEDKKGSADGHNPWNEESKRLEKEILQEYGVDSIQQLPFNFNAYLMQKGEEFQSEVYKKHFNDLKHIFEQQTNIYQTSAVLSPFIPIRLLSMNIAQTDYQTYWDFINSAEDYRIETQRFLNNNLKDNSKTGDWSYKADADFWKNLPEFEFVPKNLSQRLSENMSYILILIVWLVLPFAILLFTAKKI